MAGVVRWWRGFGKLQMSISAQDCKRISMATVPPRQGPRAKSYAYWRSHLDATALPVLVAALAASRFRGCSLPLPR